jgi:hypothetical protein
MDNYLFSIYAATTIAFRRVVAWVARSLFFAPAAAYDNPAVTLLGSRTALINVNPNGSAPRLQVPVTTAPRGFVGRHALAYSTTRSSTSAPAPAPAPRRQILIPVAFVSSGIHDIIFQPQFIRPNSEVALHCIIEDDAITHQQVAICQNVTEAGSNWWADLVNTAVDAVVAATAEDADSDEDSDAEEAEEEKDSSSSSEEEVDADTSSSSDVDASSSSDADATNRPRPTVEDQQQMEAVASALLPNDQSALLPPQPIDPPAEFPSLPPATGGSVAGSDPEFLTESETEHFLLDSMLIDVLNPTM